jgi:hypothetical protein
MNLCHPGCVDTAAREAQPPSEEFKAVPQVQPRGGTVLQEIHQRALRRAAEIIGGDERLMNYLEISEAEFSSWAGRRELPRDVFLRLVDIITEEEVRNVRGLARRKAVAAVEKL